MPNKHVIFLIHGMGEHGEGWSQAGQEIIKRAYKEYPQVSWRSFAATYEFHEIVYNNEFQALRELWEAQNLALGSVLKAQGLANELVEELNALAGITNKNNFLTTHVADVILYRFMRQTAAAVRDSIRAQLLNKLKSMDASQPIRWSIIAHSLGTAVTHDTLHGLYTDSLSIGGASLTNVTRPQVLMMLANVSRILQSDTKVYQSVVRPGAPEGQYAVRYYLNVKHEWDPIPSPRAFRPKPDWPSIDVRAENLYRDIVINAIDEKNVHGFEHYLRNPKVHTALFNALSNRDVIDQATIEAAHLKFIAKTPAGKFEEWVKGLKKFQLGEEDSLAKVLKTWASFKQTVEALS